MVTRCRACRAGGEAATAVQPAANAASQPAGPERLRPHLVIWYVFAGPFIGTTLLLLFWLFLGLKFEREAYFSFMASHKPFYGDRIIFFIYVFVYLYSAVPFALVGVVMRAVEKRRFDRLMVASLLAPIAVLLVAYLCVLAVYLAKGGVAVEMARAFGAFVLALAFLCVPASLITLLLHPEYQRRALARGGVHARDMEASMADTDNNNLPSGGEAAP
jgi:hypothetical protein